MAIRAALCGREDLRRGGDHRACTRVGSGTPIASDTRMSVPSTSRGSSVATPAPARGRAVEFLALMFVALSVTGPIAHLASLPNKIDVPRDTYFVMQRVYDGWWVLGLPWVGAACLSALAAFTSRRDRRR